MAQLASPTVDDYDHTPTVRRITLTDIKESLADGLADYSRHMAFGLGFGLFYVAVGLVAIWVCFEIGWGHMVFPALSGFLLFGPFASLGLYEISRRDQDGEKIEGTEVILSFTRHGGTQIALAAFLLLIATLGWEKISSLIYGLFYGMETIGLDTLVVDALTTWNGFLFAVTGIGFGAVIAGAIFACSVFALPMLLDRDVDVVTAAISSLRAVTGNPQAMLIWGVIVCGLTAIGMLAGFIGLAVVLPILGHATWHLYSRVLRDRRMA